MLDEIAPRLLIETYESLDTLDQDPMVLEESPCNRDRVSDIFRSIHTFKGESCFLAISKLEKVTHLGKSLPVPLRHGELTLNNQIANSRLSMVEAVGSIPQSTEQGREERDDTALADTSQRVNQIAPELQAGAVNTRMQPISNARNKLLRTVCDPSHCCGKQVQPGMEAALALSSLSKLEESSGSDIERDGRQPVLQHRGEVRPSVSLAEHGQVEQATKTQLAGRQVARIMNLAHLAAAA